MSSSGLNLAVRYALPPSQLGFCGPQEEQNQKLLAGFAKGQKIPQSNVASSSGLLPFSLCSKVRRVLEKFEAMYPYLCLIAQSNRVADPFDEQVVKAFWVGNGLLDRVRAEDLRQLIVTKFVGPLLLSEEEAKIRAAQVKEGMVPHHSFHVLVLGSVTGRVELAGAMKDLCRIGWGRALEVRDQRQEIRVKYRPLISGEDGKMGLGEEVEREVEWDEETVPKIRIGDLVSFHWGQVCDVLSRDDVANLEHYTEKTLLLL